MDFWVVLVLYAVVGGLFQAVGRLDDSGNYTGGVVSGILCGVLVGFLITEHRVSTLLLGGLLVGFLVSGMLCSIGYYFGLASVLTMVFYSGTPPVAVGFLLVIAGSVFLDEVLTLEGGSDIFVRVMDFHPFVNIILLAFFFFDVSPLMGVVAFVISEITFRLGAVAFEK